MRLLSVADVKTQIDDDIKRKKAELARIIGEVKKVLALFEEARAKSQKQLDQMELEKLRLQGEITALQRKIDS